MSEENATLNLTAEPDEIEALFVQTAGNMTYEDGYLTLYDLAPTTLLFSDWPDRVTGHLPSEEFLDSWGEGDDRFASNPPNAVLSVFGEDEVHDVVVVLRGPALGGDEMRYSGSILEGEMPASGGANALYRRHRPAHHAGLRHRGRRRTARAMGY